MLTGQNQQHTVWAEVVHFAPDQVANQQALGGRVQPNILALMAIVQDHSALARHAHRHLLQSPMRMKPPGDTGLRAKNVIDPLDIKRDRFERF